MKTRKNRCPVAKAARAARTKAAMQKPMPVAEAAGRPAHKLPAKPKPRRGGGGASVRKMYAQPKARKTENTPAANAAGVPFHTTTLGQEKIL